MEIRHDLELGCEEGHVRECGVRRFRILGDEGAKIDGQRSECLARILTFLDSVFQVWSSPYRLAGV